MCNSGFAEGIYAHIDRLSLDQGADLCSGVEDPVAVVELIRSKAPEDVVAVGQRIFRGNGDRHVKITGAFCLVRRYPGKLAVLLSEDAKA